MKSVKISKKTVVLEVLRYNTITFNVGFDDDADVFYSFLITHKLSSKKRLFYRNITDVISDLNEILLESANDEDMDLNAKGHMIYDISILIKILKHLYK